MATYHPEGLKTAAEETLVEDRSSSKPPTPQGVSLGLKG